MKRTLVIISTILIMSVHVFAQSRYEPGVILLKVRQPDIVSFIGNQVLNGSFELRMVFERYQPVNLHKISHVDRQTDGLYRLEYNLDALLDSIRKELAACPDILRARFNYYGVLAATPDDPKWPDQWALQLIDMTSAWDITKSDNTIVVGVMDTGLDYTHEDLVDNVWQNLDEDADEDGHTLEYIDGEWVLDPGDLNGIDDDDWDNNPETFKDDLVGWNFVGYGNNNPQDPIYHGTNAAGVIAARTDNATGVAGIAGGWENQTGIRLVGTRIVTDMGVWSEQDAVECINYLTELKQHKGYTFIVNMSIQTIGTGDEPLPEFAEAISSARNAGVIMIAAAGNTRSETGSPYNDDSVYKLPIPARYTGVMAIGASKHGATLQEERKSVYSLYDFLDKLLIVAPVDTHITKGINVYTTKPHDGYDKWYNGTSAAAPIVTGVVALMLSVNPYLSRADIENILKNTAEKIGPYTYTNGHADEVGYGRINAYAALEKTVWVGSVKATAYNNSRKLVKNGNNLYLCYEFGNQIFFKKSTDNGTTWTTPTHLSNTSGTHKYPCITERNGVLYVVWQEYKGSGSYDIHFAMGWDGGNSWPFKYVVTYATLPYDPLPVIQATVTSQNNPCLLIVFRRGTYPGYALTSFRTNSSMPSGPGIWTEEWVPGTGSYDYRPSLAGRYHYYDGHPVMLLAYQNSGGTIYYNYYHNGWGSPGGGWSSRINLSSIVPGSATHETPSISSSDNTSPQHVVWHRDTGSGLYGHTLVHRKSNNFESWPSEYSLLYYCGQKLPSVTGVGSYEAYCVYQYSEDNRIYKQRWDGSWWSGPSGTAKTSWGETFPRVSTLHVWLRLIIPSPSRWRC